MTFAGHIGRIIDSEKSRFNPTEVEFIKDNKDEIGKLTGFYLNFRTTMSKAFESIHEYYSITNADEALVLQGNHVEVEAKKSWLNGFVSNAWIDKGIFCSFISSKMNGISFNKRDVIVSYQLGLAEYASAEKTDLKEAFGVSSKFAFAAWQHYGFKSAIEYQKEGKEIIERALKSRGVR